MKAESLHRRNQIFTGGARWTSSRREKRSGWIFLISISRRKGARRERGNNFAAFVIVGASAGVFRRRTGNGRIESRWGQKLRTSVDRSNCARSSAGVRERLSAEVRHRNNKNLTESGGHPLRDIRRSSLYRKQFSFIVLLVHTTARPRQSFISPRELF